MAVKKTAKSPEKQKKGQERARKRARQKMWRKRYLSPRRISMYLRRERIMTFIKSWGRTLP